MKFAPISDRLSGLGAAKWAVHAEGLRRASLGEPIILLSIGEPDLPPPTSVLDTAAASMRAGRTRYAHGQGEPQTLIAIANHLTQRSGVPVAPEQVLFTAGTQNGLCTALLTLAQTGDEVLVPDPYYATYEGLVAASGATFVPVATRPEDNFHVTAEPMRSRKLLLHREQIRKLQERMAKERPTLVPLSMLLKNGRVKVELALAKGRQKEDRRQAIAEKESKLEMHREAGRQLKGTAPLSGKQSGARSGSRSSHRDSED